MRTMITEAEYEKMVDRIVMRRLATDSAYNNAEDAESQSHREVEITKEVERSMNERYEVM